MSPRDAGSRRQAARVEGGVDRYEALLEVLEQQAERADAEDRRPRRGDRSSRWKVSALVALLALTAWLWILPPAWLVPPPPAPPPIAEQEAALRFGMYLQAQRIRAFQLREGALPVTLEEAGEPLPGMSYVLVAPGVYELTGRTDEVRLTYRSDMPLREWVGAGADVVDEGLIP